MKINKINIGIIGLGVGFKHYKNLKTKEKEKQREQNLQKIIWTSLKLFFQERQKKV